MNMRRIAGIFLTLLVAKFFWTLLRFDVPLGYDPGIYRYLFLQYESALSTLSMPDLLPWAREHPPGLFILGAVLMKLGISVDILIGGVWNAIPVVLACVLAWVVAKRKEPAIGVLVLLIVLLSSPYYDGFYAMYYKAYVALILVCLTYYFVEKFSPWFLLTALLTIAVHHQTGLIMTMALGVWWIIQFPAQRKNIRYKWYSIGLVAIAVIGLLIYLPHFERVFWSPLKSIFLLRGDDAPAGSFPETKFYISTMCISLLFSAIGFWRNVQTERGSLWQLSVIACAIFIVFRLVFYKRFFLHLDFFLIPFAAEGIWYLWNRNTNTFYRSIIGVLVVAQGVISFQGMQLRGPIIPLQELKTIQSLESTLPEGTAIVTLDNVTAPWLLGWMPRYTVGAPGLFDYPKDGTIEEWEKFILGENADREQILLRFKKDLYLYISPIFMEHYREYAQNVINDPCLHHINGTPLYHSLCRPQ